MDAVRCKRLKDALIGFAAHQELPVSGTHRKLDPDHHAEFFDADDAARLERLEQPGPKLRILHQLLADPFDQALDEHYVAIERHPELELHDLPVATLIGQPADLTERDRVDGAAMVAKPQKAQRDTFYSAPDLPELNVLTDPEGVLQQVKNAGDDIAHEGLRAESNRDANDPGAGQ